MQVERKVAITIVAGAVGGAVAIAAMEALSAHIAFPLMFVPFATSIVLVMGMPDAEPAQPRALVGGHLVATVVGLLVLSVTGPSPWAAAAAVGLSMGGHAFHPHLSSAGRHRSLDRGGAGHVLEFPVRPGSRRSRAARSVLLDVAQSASARLLAGAVVVGPAAR
jgi:hypothetical protein